MQVITWKERGGAASDSDDFEGLREMLSPKKNSFPPSDDAIGRRTRTHLQLTDDALKEAEHELER